MVVIVEEEVVVVVVVVVVLSGDSNSSNSKMHVINWFGSTMKATSTSSRTPISPYPRYSSLVTKCFGEISLSL